MRVTVKLFATLRDGRFDREEKHYNQSLTVKGIIDDLDIPETEVALILVNRKHAEADHVVADGDVVALFPPVGGG